MTPLETVKAAIAETPDESGLSPNPWTIREILSGFFEEMYSLKRDAGNEPADRILTEAARHAVKAMPITDAMVEAGAAAIANARAGNYGAPPISNPLAVLPAKLKAEVLKESRACLYAAKVSTMGGE